MFYDTLFKENYPLLSEYTAFVKTPERDIIGRDEEIKTILATFHRPELRNVILLAEAGTGKTALIQGAMMCDKTHQYLEVDLSRMISNLVHVDELASKLKMLFDEVSLCGVHEKTKIVLFIDEFHLIVQLSAAAVEALKPLLADSGTRNICVVAATTYDEFMKYISPNQPLVERLSTLKLEPPSKEMVIRILKNMARRYDVLSYIDDSLYHLIYEYTNRYIPASSQPRKSILLLDAMVGWYRLNASPLNETLLNYVIYHTQKVDVAFKADILELKNKLDAKVFSQDFATRALERNLQVCVAGLNDPTRPKGSFLFVGPSGVGKSEIVKQLAVLLFNDPRSLIRFDMTEYANNDSLSYFQNELTSRVWARPNSIILLDEIEKASSFVTRLLLQVLDDGRLSDVNHREVSFINSYIIMTANVGADILTQFSTYAAEGKSFNNKIEAEFEKYQALLRESITATTAENRFPVELVGRVDCIVPFLALSEEVKRKILKTKIDALILDVYDRHGMKGQYDDISRVLDHLYAKYGRARGNAGGARALVAGFKSELMSAVARFINTNPTAHKYKIVVEGSIATDNKKTLDSTSYIVVQ